METGSTLVGNATRSLQKGVSAGGGGIYEGWLLKQATSISAVLTFNGWRRRWCVLHQDKLEWYNEKNDDEPRGVIAFGPDCSCEHKGLVKNRYYSFCVSVGNNSVHFASDTYELSSRWVEVINAKIRQATIGSKGNRSIHGPSSFIIDMEKKTKKQSFTKKKSSVRDAISSLIGSTPKNENKSDPSNNNNNNDDAVETESEDETNDDEDDSGLVSEESLHHLNQRTMASRFSQVAGSSLTILSEKTEVESKQSGFPSLRKAKSLHGDFYLNSLSPQDNSLEIEYMKECSRRSTHRTLVQNSRDWTLIGQRNGMRIFIQPDPLSRIDAPYTFKVQLSVPVHANLAFEALMDLSESRKKWDPTFSKGEVIKEEGTSSIIKWCMEWSHLPSYSPLGISDRSIVVARHWRRDPLSGSYIILYRPILESAASSHYYPGTIHSKLFFGAIYITSDEETIFSTNDKDQNDEDYDAFASKGNTTITFALQMDMGGWLGAYSPFSYFSGQSAECICAILSSVVGLDHYQNSLTSVERKTFLDISLGRKKEEEERKKNMMIQRLAIKASEKNLAASTLASKESQKQQSVEVPKVQVALDVSQSTKDIAAAPVVNIPVEPTPPIELNFVYDVPLDSTSVIPKHLSNDQKSCWWDSGDDTNFYKVRGPNYLIDKVKVNTKVSTMEIVAVQLQLRPDPISNISAHPDFLIQRQHAGRKDRPFLIVLNFIVPTVGNWTTYFAHRRGVERDPIFERMLQNFMDGDDEYRNTRFKIIPGIVEGPWVVQKGVGNKPAILGTKIKCNYYKGDNCYEIEVDISSSKVAGSVLSLVRAYTQYITIDLAFLIESQSFNELPERLLGSLRAKSPNLG